MILLKKSTHKSTRNFKIYAITLFHFKGEEIDSPRLFYGFEKFYLTYFIKYDKITKTNLDL